MYQKTFQFSSQMSFHKHLNAFSCTTVRYNLIGIKSGAIFSFAQKIFFFLCIAEIDGMPLKQETTLKTSGILREMICHDVICSFLAVVPLEALTMQSVNSCSLDLAVTGTLPRHINKCRTRIRMADTDSSHFSVSCLHSVSPRFTAST